jgi:exodeoxyribonuclease-3
MPKKVRVISWNVNGVRAVYKKDLMKWIGAESPDVLCLQETKCQVPQLPAELAGNPLGYGGEWHCGERPGYSGVATLSKMKPVAVTAGLSIDRFDREGRWLETDYGDFVLINCYFPNGGSGPERLAFKHDFYKHALERLAALRKQGRKVDVCGDFNIAHEEIDVFDPARYSKVSGFLPEERVWLNRLVDMGFIDTFREFDKSAEKYSWWDMRIFARKRNLGWRIDYHFASADLKPHLKEAFILPDVLGSDHCPVGITLTF